MWRCPNTNRDITKVLCVNLEGSIAGAEQSLLLLCRFMPERIEVAAACPAGDLCDKLNESGIRTYRISAPPRTCNYLFLWAIYLLLVNLQLTGVVLKVKAQIIHANSTKAVLAVILPGLFICPRIIWHVRDLRCPRWRAKICGWVAAKTIAVSHTVKTELIRLGVRDEDIDVIYNGVVTEETAATTRQLDQRRPITFANVGQFVPWKKQSLFIEAAERFLRQGLKAQFMLVGDDVFGRNSQYRRTLAQKIKTSPFASNIEIVSWQDDLLAFWPQIDALVHTADTEPFGRVIIEAMAYGIPVIAAAAGGPAEIISPCQTGFLFVPNDTEGLLDMMVTVFHDRELAHNVAERARRHVHDHFQACQTAQRIVRVYEELTAV